MPRLDLAWLSASGILGSALALNLALTLALSRSLALTLALSRSLALTLAPTLALILTPRHTPITLKGTQDQDLSCSFSDSYSSSQSQTLPHSGSQPHADCVRHPWLAQHAPTQTHALPKAVLDSLQKFQKAKRFKQTVLSVIAANLKPAEIAHFRGQFDSLDRDADGFVSISELVAVIQHSLIDSLSHSHTCLFSHSVSHSATHTHTNMSSVQHSLELQVMQAGNENGIDTSSAVGRQRAAGFVRRAKAMMNAIDSAGDGRISLMEFVAAAMRSSLYLQRDKLQTAFETFDANGDGFISMDELSLGIQAHGKPCTEEQLAEMLQAADLNRDGVIDFDEFLTLMREPTSKILSKF